MQQFFARHDDRSGGSQAYHVDGSGEVRRARIIGRNDAVADPQLAHRQALAEIADAGGTFLALNPPFRLSGTRTAAQPFAAALGEHTEEVLTELGYTPAEIAALRG